MKFNEVNPFAVGFVNSRLRGARIDKISMPVKGVYKLAVFLHGSGRQVLLLSAARGVRLLLPLGSWHTRYLADTTAFVMGLRKHLTGAVLQEASLHVKRRLVALSLRSKSGQVMQLLLGKEGVFLFDEAATVLQTDAPGVGIDLPGDGWSDCGDVVAPLESLFEKSAADLSQFFFDKECARIRGRISKELRRRERILAKLVQDRLRFSTHQSLREQAELFKSQLYLAKRGMHSVMVEDYYSQPAGGKVEVALDPLLSPADNLEKMFKLVKKYQRGLESIQKREAEINAEIESWKKLESRLYVVVGGDFDELRAVADAVFPRKKKAPPKKIQQKSSEVASYCRVFDLGPVVIYAGKSAKGNEYASFRVAGGNDLWLHAHNYPGSHVVLKRKQRSYRFTAADIRDAAIVALYYSQAKGKGKEEVIYTEAKHVKKVPGAAPGKVTLAGGKVVVAVSDEPAFKAAINRQTQGT